MDGLSCLNVLSSLRENRFLELVFFHIVEPLTAEILTDLFTIKFAEEGSDRRSGEQGVASRWLDILLEIEGS